MRIIVVQNMHGSEDNYPGTEAKNEDVLCL